MATGSYFQDLRSNPAFQGAQGQGRGIGDRLRSGWNSISDTLFGGKAGDAIDPNKARYADENYLRDILKGNIANYGGRQAPMAGAAMVDPAQQAQFRRMQMETANRLGQIASGEQKGAGELAVDRQIAQAQAAQMANQRMARGGNAALAARAAARATAGLGVAGAGQAQQAAMGDQANALSQLIGLSGQGRGQDLALAGQNAGFQQQTNLANQGAQLQQTGLNDQATLTSLGQLLGMNSDQMRAFLQAQAMQAQLNAQDTGILGDLMQMGGSLGAAYLGRPQGTG